MTPFNELKNRAKKAIYIIWGSLTASSLLYGVIGYLEVEFRKTNSGVFLGKEYFFYYICFLFGLLNIFLYRYLLSNKRIQKRLEKEISPEKLAEKCTNKNEKEKLLAKLLLLNQDELKLYSVFSFQFIILCICMSTNNLIALAGFLLVLSEGSMTYMFPLLIISTLLNIYMYPRPEAYLIKVKDALNSNGG